MRTNRIIVLFIILASCTPSTSLKGTNTPGIPINSETPIPTFTPSSCPPADLIYDLHTPENVNELIGKHFSHPIPQHHLDDIRFRMMRFLNNSSNYVLAWIDVGNKSTITLGEIICDGKISQTSPQTYGFYQIKGVVILPNGKEHESLNLTCSSVDGVFDGSVAGWGSYEPNVNEYKKPQIAWRANELTESLAETETDNIKCWFGGP